jgi:hypothetical protein
VKKTAFIIFILILAGRCFAQETVKKKNKLTSSVTEIFQVLKTNDSIKSGLYQAVYKSKIALASGLYTQNKKTGVWHFYDTQGNLIENFNYDTHSLAYEQPMDSLTNREIIYAFDNKFADTDHVTRPVKPGGRSYGYIPYLRIFQLPQSMADISPAQYIGVLEILVSPGGRLADFKIHIKSAYSEYITTFSPELIDEEDKIFIPATLNRQPIISRIFVKCRLTDSGQLDID